MRAMRRSWLLCTIVVVAVVVRPSEFIRADDAPGPLGQAVDSRALLESGVLALAAGDLPRAELLLTTAVEAGRLSGHRGLLFGALTHLAGVRVEQGRFTDGLALMTEAIPVADALALEGNGAPPELGVTVRLQLMRLLRAHGSAPDAEAMGWEALAAAVESGKFEPAVPVVQELIDVAAAQGARGDELALRAVEMDELLAGLPGYAQTHGGRGGAGAIAELMSASGRGLSQERALEDAEAYFGAALRLYSAANDVPAALAACGDITWITLQLDRRDRTWELVHACGSPAHEAEFALRRGRGSAGYARLATSAEPGYERGVFFSRAGRAATAHGEYEEAAALHTSAVREFLGAESVADAGAEQVETGVALLRAGRQADAEQRLDEGLKAVMEQGRPVHPEARIRGLLARSTVRASRGSWEAARADVVAAGEGLFELRRNHDLARTAAELAALRHASGDVEGALEAYEKAVDFEAEAGLLDEGRWGLDGLAAMLADAGDADAALDAWTRSLDRADRWTRGRVVPDILKGEADGRRLGDPLPHPLFAPLGLAGPRRAVGLLVALGRVEEAFVMSERIRAIEWRALIERDPDPTIGAPGTAVEEALLRIREQVDALRDRARGLAFEARDREAEERDLRNRLEVYRVRQADLLEALDPSAVRSLAPTVPDLDAIRAALGDRVLLSTFRSGDDLIGFLVRDGEVTASVRPAGDLRGLVAGASAPRAKPPVKKAARELAARLYGDHAAAIRGRRVVLVLDGALRHVPLHRLDPAPRVRIEDWVAGLALAPAAATLGADDATAQVRFDAAKGWADRMPMARPTVAVLVPPGPRSPPHASKYLRAWLHSMESSEAVPLSLDRLVAGGELTGRSLAVNIFPGGVAPPSLGPGHAAEGLPGPHDAGDAYLALGELAAMREGGLLSYAPLLEYDEVEEVFNAALAAGSPPDVAWTDAIRVLRRAARGVRFELRWYAP